MGSTSKIPGRLHGFEHSVVATRMVLQNNVFHSIKDFILQLLKGTWRNRVSTEGEQ